MFLLLFSPTENIRYKRPILDCSIPMAKHGLQEKLNLEERFTYYKSSYSYSNLSFRARFIDRLGFLLFARFM